MMLAAVAVVAFVAVAGAVFWLSEQQARKMQVGIPNFSSQEFRLTDHSGASRSAADFSGAASGTVFGYTYCPDCLPDDTYPACQCARRVGDRGLDTAALQNIFVTVDAERDTPEQLAAYLSLFDTEVTGLTGSSEALVKVQRDFGAYASRVEREDGVALWDHTATVYLYDADGRFTGTIVFNEPPEFVTEKLARLFQAG